MKKSLSVKVKVTIHGETLFFGPGIAELLELIRETGSVKEACQTMGLSYSKGWFIINRAEHDLGYPVIERSHGGREGGGASLTPEGQKLLSLYRDLEKRVNDCAKEEFDAIFGPEGKAVLPEEERK